MLKKLLSSVTVVAVFLFGSIMFKLPIFSNSTSIGVVKAADGAPAYHLSSLEYPCCPYEGWNCIGDIIVTPS